MPKWKIALILVGLGIFAALVERLVGRLHWDGVPVRGLVPVALGLAFWSWRRRAARAESEAD